MRQRLKNKIIDLGVTTLLSYAEIAKKCGVRKHEVEELLDADYQARRREIWEKQKRNRELANKIVKDWKRDHEKHLKEMEQRRQRNPQSFVTPSGVKAVRTDAVHRGLFSSNDGLDEKVSLPYISCLDGES